MPTLLDELDANRGPAGPYSLNYNDEGSPIVHHATRLDLTPPPTGSVELPPRPLERSGGGPKRTKPWGDELATDKGYGFGRRPHADPVRHETVTGFVHAAFVDNAAQVPIRITPRATPKTCHMYAVLAASRRVLRYRAIRRLSLTGIHHSEVVTMLDPSLPGQANTQAGERLARPRSPPQAGVVKTKDLNAASKPHSVVAESAGGVLPWVAAFSQMVAAVILNRFAVRRWPARSL